MRKRKGQPDWSGCPASLNCERILVGGRKLDAIVFLQIGIGNFAILDLTQIELCGHQAAVSSLTGNSNSLARGVHFSTSRKNRLWQCQSGMVDLLSRKLHFTSYKKELGRG